MIAIEHKKKGSGRLHSLDALRGFDMFWIISGEGIFHGLSAATDNPFFNGVSKQLHHSPWNGFTFYDMIFPLFIFISGVSMPWSFGRQLEQEGINKAIVKKNIYRLLIRRTLLLLLLGMVVNGLLQWQGYNNTRFASVLGRIGLACFFAAVIFLNNDLRGQVIWFFILLLGYWAAMMWVPVPGYGSGVLTPEGNLAGYVDRILLPGKLHRGSYDPEGILSTIPAIGTAMLGIFTGQFLRSSHWKANKTTKGSIIAGAGVVLVALGFLWGLSFPVNKNMWTSSFVLYAGGWSLLLFSFFYLLIDAWGQRKWSMPFVWIGMNSILIYVAAHGIIDFKASSDFIFGGLIIKAPVAWQPVWSWVGICFIQLCLLYFLFRKKWFLKV